MEAGNKVSSAITLSIGSLTSCRRFFDTTQREVEEKTETKSMPISVTKWKTEVASFGLVWYLNVTFHTLKKWMHLMTISTTTSLNLRRKRKKNPIFIKFTTVKKEKSQIWYTFRKRKFFLLHSWWAFYKVTISQLDLAIRPSCSKSRYRYPLEQSQA